MKRIILSLTTLFVLTQVGFAQNQNSEKVASAATAETAPPSKEKMDKKDNRMKEELNLSDEQTKKMKSIRDNTNTKLDAVKQDNTLTDEQKKEKSKSIMKASKEERKAVLTPEQVKKMEDIKKSKPEKEKKESND